MPKRLPADLLDQVGSLLGRHSNGLTLREIEETFVAVVSRRTLQRRLNQWVRGGQLSALGVRRYFSQAPTTPKDLSDFGAGVPVSAADRQNSNRLPT